MIGRCPYDCEYKTKKGYCKYTGCLNPKYSQIIFWKDNYNTVPPGCVNCMNHPSNGGSGFCNCTVGCQTIY